MLGTHILPILFPYIPQSILTITITCALLGVKGKWSKIIPMGILLGIEMYGIGFFTGSYILVMLGHYCFVLAGLIILKVSDPYKIAICTSITWTIVLMLEFLCLKFWSLSINLQPSLFTENPIMRIKVFSTQVMVALTINILLKYFKLSIFDE